MLRIMSGMTPRTTETREHRFTVLMTPDERAKLERLATADHRSAGDWVRVAIATAFAERFGEEKPKRKR